MTNKIYLLSKRLSVTLRKEFGLRLDVDRVPKDENYFETVRDLVSSSRNAVLHRQCNDLKTSLYARWGTECGVSFPTALLIGPHVRGEVQPKSPQGSSSS